jgi:hypothetical protein
VTPHSPDRPSEPPAWGRGAACVFNRSDRVWVCWVAQFMPFVMLFAGAGLLYLLAHEWAVRGEVLSALLLVLLVIPYAFDWVPAFNPVRALVLTDQLRVVRVGGQARDVALDRILRVEILPVTGEEYDERYRGRSMTDVTVALNGARPLRLLTTREEAAALAAWARRNGRPVAGNPT